MKNNLFLLACTTLFSFVSQAQNFVGDWYGKLDIGVKIPIILHVKQEKKNKYSATLDSPSQKAFDLQANQVTLKKGQLFVQFSQLNAEILVKTSDKGLSGTFTQFGNLYPLNLYSDSSVIAPAARPQEPKPPFTYNSENVTFTNTEDKVTLAGTLTYPKNGKNFKAVILVSGSGPQDRNEEMLNHKPFLVLSDYLTSRGIAVLRYDDRGFGQSKGSFSESTIYNFAKDAKAAVNYLRSLPYIDQNHTGVIGHSEGGMIAQMLAA
ncbi:MAG TPA: alpha/beta hydrolase, partial [Crocinitomicaceae bacterium]|nr:alpha/beta hydrolase [Crocinitomicaceae bacterium]